MATMLRVNFRLNKPPSALKRKRDLKAAAKKTLWGWTVAAALVFAALPSLLQTSTDQKTAPGAKETCPIIMNGKVPQPRESQRKKLVFEEELSIGQAEGSENYMFGENIAFNTDRAGNFFVTDWDRKRIQKYDPSGKYLLTMGKPGQGPGEFQTLSLTRFIKNEEMYVTDIVPRQISYFDKNRRFLKKVTLPGIVEDAYLIYQGKYVATLSKQTLSGQQMGFEITDGLFDENLKLIVAFHSTTMALKPPGGTDADAMVKFTANLLSTMAFQPAAHHLVSKDELIYSGFSEKYEIQVYAADGRKLRTIARDYDPIKVGEKDKAYFVENIVERMARLSAGTNAKEVAKLIDYPKLKPAYSSFVLIENGWLLVCVEFIQNEYTLFDLFNDKGTYIGQFKAKIAPDGLFFNNGKAYNIATEDGYKYAKRYSFKIQDY